MKRLFTILILCYSGLTIFAQSSWTVSSKEKTAGKNFITHTDINAIEHVFPVRIENYNLDTSTNLLTLQLRGLSENGKLLKSTGKVVLYDLTNRREKWIIRINYQQSNIQQYNDVLVQNKANAAIRLSLETGKKQWRISKKILYIDPFTGIGIGYPSGTSFGYTKNLEAFDLSNGNRVWFREINREYGWNDMIHLNDSEILLVAAGLHTINLKTGAGWDYNTITGAEDYTTAIIANTAGIVVGLLTGTFMIYTGNDVVTDIVSNVLRDSTNLYFASKEKIAGFDMDGKNLWYNLLPKKKASKSSIFVKDSLIYMVNFGYAFMGGYRQIDFGVPFIAAFNKFNGRQVFMNEIDVKGEQIADYLIGDNEILLLFKNRVARYTMYDGTLINETIISNEETGDLKSFTGEHLYIESDSVYQSLMSSDPSKLYLVTANNKIVTINEKFEIQDITDFEKVYNCYLWTDDMKFLARGKETIVIDGENKRIAEIEASPRSFLVGTKLYDIQDKSFLEFDLSGLFGIDDRDHDKRSVIE